MKCLKDKSGLAYPLAIAIILILLMFMCVLMEFFRLNIIATGVRNAMQDAIVTTVNDNYSNVYHGVREGYSGGYEPFRSSFAYTVDEGDIYSYLDKTLGTENQNGTHVKYAMNVVEYSISDLEVTIRNAPLAPSSPENAQSFEADAVILLEVPVQFIGEFLPPMRITLKVQAGYIEIF